MYPFSFACNVFPQSPVMPLFRLMRSAVLPERNPEFHDWLKLE